MKTLQQPETGYKLEKEINRIQHKLSAREELLQALRNQLNGLTQYEREFLHRMQSRRLSS